MHIAVIDWIVLIAYLALISVIGLVAGLRVKDTEHFFLGKRRFGKWLMVGQTFGVGTHAEMPVSLAGAVYAVGLSGIWYQWKNLFATPFYWLIAPIFRRFRRTTTAEIMEDRYGSFVGAVYAIFAICYLTINTASMLKGAAKVIRQAIGGQVPVNQIVLTMTVVFILYSFVGGLVASVWTDFFQGFLILALSFMLVPLGWKTVGGIVGMKEGMEHYRLLLTTPRGIGPWMIFMLTVNGLVGIMAQPHMMAAVGTGKDEHTCRVGLMYGMFAKRLCTVGWAMVGLMVATMTAHGVFGTHALRDPEDAFGFACRHLLFPGSLGLLIASVLAANMSACSAFMVDSGALFTQTFYRKYLRAGRPDRHYLWVGRLSGLAITLMGVAYAVFLIQRVLNSFLLTETLATFVGISVLGGIIWPRANRWGAISSIAAAMGTNFAAYALRGERFDHWDPNVFFIALSAGIAALIAVSLLTPAEAEAGKFAARLQTPTDEPLPETETVSAPPFKSVAERGCQLLVVNALAPLRAAYGLGLRRAYREDLAGFLIGWGVVALLVLFTWGIFCP